MKKRIIYCLLVILSVIAGTYCYINSNTSVEVDVISESVMTEPSPASPKPIITRDDMNRAFDKIVDGEASVDLEASKESE